MHLMNLKSALQKFQRLEPELSASGSKESYRDELKALFAIELARTVRNIIYVWQSKKEIPRVKGKNSILYIGKTSQSLTERYSRYINILSDGDNWVRDSYIMKEYGPITVSICDYSKLAETLADAEKNLIRLYFQEHLELPPQNYSS